MHATAITSTVAAGHLARLRGAIIELTLMKRGRGGRSGECTGQSIRAARQKSRAACAARQRHANAQSGGPEADLRVRAVAKGLTGAAPATTQVRRCHARHRPSAAAEDLEVAANLQRPVLLRIDREHAIARGQRPGLTARRLAAGAEADLVMRAVAVGFVLRSPTPAQRGAKARARPIDLQLRAKGIRAALAHARKI